MSFDALEQAIITRLDQSDRGDRGWWLITRVHLTAAKILEVTRYLSDVAGNQEITLTDQHFSEIGDIVGIDNQPAMNIKRHYFLAMDQPLGLIERLSPPSWQTIRLTAAGRALARADDPVDVFERILLAIRFCREPWFSEGRCEQYSEFDVTPYPAVLDVMSKTSSYIDMDEFDLFVSRIRNDGEIEQAAEMIMSFRNLSLARRTQLLAHVSQRIPAEGTGKNKNKAYLNWRDVARHTFSLFSLGASAERDGNALWLTKEFVSSNDSAPAVPADSGKNAVAPAGAAPKAQVTEVVAKRVPTTAPRAPRQRSKLLIPANVAPPELLLPPAASPSNGGLEAELLVAKMFKSAGWAVVFYSRKRGYGFDLWVRKGEQAFVVEVKSFTGVGTSVVLTEMENAAAHHHGDNYLLVVVEKILDSPELFAIQNPASCLQAIETNTAQYSIARSSWLPQAMAFEP
ncbi:DUF3883 domain-containing protein [Sphingomonas sp. G-3-2-10]|uniref:protein NO VEIN domain-containing protein n=1 Tax=Sphingomonas sp. G-3-2-10 TaxID=2728838 RepID=UPI00146CFA0D|nr:DUF3883 domain-containing protein [Sphingomonas sp. G-3-2-10]NML06526.1 AlwI family type II restriction endonuclease [Sphingomonas sp. G-3-2-10]